jgi:SAM-dependent methyltransferase
VTQPRRRESLSSVGGAVTTRGDPAVAARLADAWRATSGPARELTHGFHAYPARSHPRLVRSLVGAFSRAGELVVDPFCGSGTTLVEAFAAGRRAFGGDVNEVAVRLARLKTRRVSGPKLRELVASAQRIARRAAGAVRQGDDDVDLDDDVGEFDAPLPPKPATSSVPAAVSDWFEPHVWRELDLLGRAIDEVRSPAAHGALLLVLSSLLTKVSRRRAETSDERVEKAIARGFVARLFAERAEELADGLGDLAAAAPSRTPAPSVAIADARALPLRDGVASLVVTSPPYLGTYDYAAIQELRGRLLGIELRAARRAELGGRAAANVSARAEHDRFVDGLSRALREVERVLARDGTALVVIGDATARGVDAASARGDALVEAAAAATSLRVVAVASQERRESRREHLLALRR